MVNYIHRVGRTGRAGKSGKAYTFFTDEDKPLVRSLADLLKRSACAVPEWLFKIKKAKRSEMKLLAKRGLRREAISQNPRDHTDPDFSKDIKKMDAWYHEDKKWKEANGVKTGVEGPSIVLNTPEEVQAFFEANPHLAEGNPELIAQMEAHKAKQQAQIDEEGDSSDLADLGESEDDE